MIPQILTIPSQCHGSHTALRDTSVTRVYIVHTSALTFLPHFFFFFTEKDEWRLQFSRRNSAIKRPPFFQNEGIPCTSDLMPLSCFLNFGLPRLQKDGGSRFHCPRAPFIRAECTSASCRDSDLLGRSQFCPTYKSFSNRKVLPFSHTDALTFRYVVLLFPPLFCSSLES